MDIQEEFLLEKVLNALWIYIASVRAPESWRACWEYSSCAWCNAKLTSELTGTSYRVQVHQPHFHKGTGKGSCVEAHRPEVEAQSGEATVVPFPFHNSSFFGECVWVLAP